MTAEPVHEQDPRDPRTILARLPESKREEFLQQYRAAVDAAHQPEGYQQLQTLLQIWSVRAKVYQQQPDYDEEMAARAEEIRSGAVEAVPIEQVIADYYGIPLQDAEAIWAGKTAQARAERVRRIA